jgi:hypothetical protein
MRPDRSPRQNYRSDCQQKPQVPQANMNFLELRYA